MPRRPTLRLLFLICSARSRPVIRQIFLVVLGLLLLAAWQFELGNPHPRAPKPEPDTIEYHIKRLTYFQLKPIRNKPTDLKSCFTLETIKWLMEGRATESEHMAHLHHHSDALVRLGYLERVRVPWSGTNLQKILSNFSITVTNPATSPLASIVLEGPNSLEFVVTAHKSDLPALQKLINSLNITNPIPNGSP